MKRFYCTVCEKMKRVRNYPTDVQFVDALDPTMRVGTCSRHTDGWARPQRMRAQNQPKVVKAASKQERKRA